MSKRTPKNSKIKHNTHVVLRWHKKYFESNKRQWISFRPQRWHVPYRNHHAYCEKLWFVRTLYPNLPQMGQKIYHDMLMPLHDSIPSFMNFKRVLDLLEFKNEVSQCLRPSDGGRVFEIHSHFLHGTKACTQGQRFDFSTNLYAPEHVHVVQIWIMHINALKTQLMHKNVQTNHEKSQKLTQHSCCSMLTREFFWKQ